MQKAEKALQALEAAQAGKEAPGKSENATAEPSRAGAGPSAGTVDAPV